MAQIVIVAATAAATFDFSTRRANVPMTIKAFGLASGDTVEIQQLSPDQTAENAYEGGTQIQLAYQSKTLVPITSPGNWRIKKGITTGTVQVELSYEDNP